MTNAFKVALDTIRDSCTATYSWDPRVQRPLLHQNYLKEATINCRNGEYNVLITRRVDVFDLQPNYSHTGYYDRRKRRYTLCCESERHTMPWGLNNKQYTFDSGNARHSSLTLQIYARLPSGMSARPRWKAQENSWHDFLTFQHILSVKSNFICTK